jgi:S-DNA-T family DNA segregation ATPase FtsK/SpoIIIE
MPRIIFVIDEMADLMIKQGNLIESAIVRLAQMARATGIHLVLATQSSFIPVSPQGLDHIFS